MAFRVLNIRYCPVTDTFPDDRAVITRRLFGSPSAEELTVFHKTYPDPITWKVFLFQLDRGRVRSKIDIDCDILMLGRFISTEPLGIRRYKSSDKHDSANEHISLWEL